jgi:hypothetical protein
MLLYSTNYPMAMIKKLKYLYISEHTNPSCTSDRTDNLTKRTRFRSMM